MMRQTRSIRGLVIAAVLAACVGLVTAPAPAAIVTRTTESAAIRDRDSTIGIQFTVSGNTVINALGVYDHNDDGLILSHDVGLWEGTTLVRSATVPSGTGATLSDDFRYVSVTDFTLTAGNTYTLGALFVDPTGNPEASGVNLTTSDPFLDSGTSVDAWAPTAGITLVNSVYVDSVTLARPTVTSGNAGRWAGANATFLNVIPTPTALPAGLAVLGLLTLRRRK